MKADKSLHSKLFYHDLINHTHSLLLYLEHKKKLNLSIPSEEIENLHHEIKILQKLIQSYFQENHQSLNHFSDNEVELVDCQDLVRKMKFIQASYLINEEQVFWDIDLSLYSNNQFDLVVFSRIFTNLFKNMAEANAQNIFISLKLVNDSLVIETKNEYTKKESDQNAREFLGLKSIKAITEELGGGFDFHHCDKFWHNKITIELISYKKNMFDHKKSA